MYESYSLLIGYCGNIKTSHKGLLLAMLVKQIKYWSGGPYLVMEITTRVIGDKSIMVVG